MRPLPSGNAQDELAFVRSRRARILRPYASATERIAREVLLAQEFDVVILGGGPAGTPAALYGAAAGCPSA